MSKAARSEQISLKDLCKCVAFGLEPIWPKHASGIQTGDIWHHSKLNVRGKPGSDLVSFHKLTQWLSESDHGYALRDEIPETFAEAGVSVHTTNSVYSYTNAMFTARRAASPPIQTTERRRWVFIGHYKSHAAWLRHAAQRL